MLDEKEIQAFSSNSNNSVDRLNNEPTFCAAHVFLEIYVLYPSMTHSESGLPRW